MRNRSISLSKRTGKKIFYIFVYPCVNLQVYWQSVYVSIYSLPKTSLSDSSDSFIFIHLFFRNNVFTFFENHLRIIVFTYYEKNQLILLMKSFFKHSIIMGTFIDFTFTSFCFSFNIFPNVDWLAIKSILKVIPDFISDFIIFF